MVYFIPFNNFFVDLVNWLLHITQKALQLKRFMDILRMRREIQFRVPCCRLRPLPFTSFLVFNLDFIYFFSNYEPQFCPSQLSKLL